MLNKIVKNIFDFAVIIALAILLTSCASGGGGSSVSAPVTPPTSGGGSTTPTQPYQTIDPIVYNYTLEPHGETTVTYRSGTYQSEDAFARTDKYKIADYGFFEIFMEGRHDGQSRNPEEAQDAGPWINAGKIHRADLNGDGHEDFYYEGFFEGDRTDMPRSYLHAFLNDGNGHFNYAPDIFSGSTCINYGDLDNKTDPNHECGYTVHLQRSIVADFNGDGIDDFFKSGNYFLSNDGVISKQNDKLPDWFSQIDNDSWLPFAYTHDNYAGDADGDGDLDVFGNYGPGQMAMLINDGTGAFTTTNYNFPETGSLWNTTAAIGDFNNDGMGDVAVGWYNPSEAQENGFGNTYENSAGAVFWNDGNNDWSNTWSELPDSYYGANGNANDMEVIDINGDGLLDIVIASTKHEPYYDGRAIQFFINNGDLTFSDVTSTYNPGIGLYANGNSASNGWWNGEGELHILDFDGDGDLDIVDSIHGTYALLNNGEGVFEMYNDWPDQGNCGGCRYYPVEIDGKWQYDFIGYTDDRNYNNSTSTFFQVLDPPFQQEICSIKTGECNPMVQMMNDITTKPEGYAKTVFNSKMLLDGVREATRGTNLLYNYTEGSSMAGYSASFDQYGIFLASLDGNSKGGLMGVDFEVDNMHSGVYYVVNELQANNDTIWYGTGTADVKYSSINTFTEFVYNKDNFVYTVGGGLAYTTVQSFTERDSAVNVKVDSFNMLDASVFGDVKYVTQSNFGTTAIGVGVDHYQSLQGTDIKFADYLEYNFKDDLTVFSADFIHTYGPFYFKASANSESLKSFELGFILRQ